MAVLIVDAVEESVVAIRDAIAAVEAATAAVQALPANLFTALHPDYASLMARLDAIEARQRTMITLLGGGLPSNLQGGRLRVADG